MHTYTLSVNYIWYFSTKSLKCICNYSLVRKRLHLILHINAFLDHFPSSYWFSNNNAACFTQTSKSKKQRMKKNNHNNNTANLIWHNIKLFVFYHFVVVILTAFRLLVLARLVWIYYLLTMVCNSCACTYCIR